MWCVCVGGKKNLGQVGGETLYLCRVQVSMYLFLEVKFCLSIDSLWCLGLIEVIVAVALVVIAFVEWVFVEGYEQT